MVTASAGERRPAAVQSVAINRPRRFLVRMVLFIIAVGVTAGVFHAPIQAAFLANPALNGLILGVLALGILYNIRQVLLLGHAVTWIEHFRSDAPQVAETPPPWLLTPMAKMLGDRRSRLSLSTMAMRSLLDGIAPRLDESRDLSRYAIGLLVFLGLLGTFWGLLQMVSSIGDVISGLSLEGADLSGAFLQLKNGLEAPLQGMGTAFSSSLFGLAGSLVLGFLDLQAGQAQNRFYNDLEEWLSGITRLSSGVLPGEGDQPIPAYVQALLEQTAESLDRLQQTVARGEDGRAAVGTQILSLAEQIGKLADQMQTEQALMLRLAEGQAELKPVLARLLEHPGGRSQGAVLDDASRAHIRNLEVYVGRIVEEMATGRDIIVQQVRSEIRLLARTIAAVAEEPDR